MFGIDEAIFRALHGENPHSVLTYVSLLLTAVGSGFTTLVAIPLLLRARSRPFIAELVLVVLVVAVVVFAIKAGVGRTRPYLSLPHVHALYMIFQPPTDHSFPSGHAAGSFSTSTFLVFRWPAQLGVWSRVGLFALATAIGLSRIYLGVHYPSDVASGALLGFAFGAAFGLGFRRRAARIAEASREVGS